MKREGMNLKYIVLMIIMVPLIILSSKYIIEYFDTTSKKVINKDIVSSIQNRDSGNIYGKYKVEDFKVEDENVIEYLTKEYIGVLFTFKDINNIKCIGAASYTKNTKNRYKQVDLKILPIDSSDVIYDYVKTGQPNSSLWVFGINFSNKKEKISVSIDGKNSEQVVDQGRFLNLIK